LERRGWEERERFGHGQLDLGFQPLAVGNDTVANGPPHREHTGVLQQGPVRTTLS
jgi:hypothetical protein